MGSFRDSKGSLWELNVTLPVVRRVRNLAGVDLLNLSLKGERKTVFSAMSDAVTFAEVIYAICKPEADQRGLTDEQFATLLDVDVNALGDVLLEAIADFFQRRNQTKAAELVRWFAKTAAKANAKMTAELTPETLEMMDAAIDREIAEQLSKLRQTSFGISTNLPESLESTVTQGTD